MILDIVDDPHVNLALKRPSVTSRPAEDVKHAKRGYNVSDLPPLAGKSRCRLTAVKAASTIVGPPLRIPLHPDTFPLLLAVSTFSMLEFIL